jgi:hypothetical protein
MLNVQREKSHGTNTNAQEICAELMFYIEMNFSPIKDTQGAYTM